jgi:pantothenate synthetase
VAVISDRVLALLAVNISNTRLIDNGFLHASDSPPHSV